MEQPLVAISYPADDKVRQANLDVLRDGAQVVFLQDQQPSQQAETLRQAEALIVGRLGHELPPGQLEEAKRLRLVQFLSAGVDHVDLTAIPAQIVIADNAGAYARPMAEHVMAMTLSLAKRLRQRHAALAHGTFDQQGMDLGLLILRLVFGALFIGHGTRKLFGWFGGHGRQAPLRCCGPWPSSAPAPGRWMRRWAWTCMGSGSGWGR
jgi:lactate dehydrogenase-like 2-hydroxyacid dehydrogenase